MKPLKIFLPACFFILFALIFQHATFAQEKIIHISGKLTDQKSGKSIAFANIGVLGTYTGAASNEQGFFEVKIPSQYMEREVQISAIGYLTYKTTVSALSQQDFWKIDLQPSAYNLSDVEIVGESTVQHARIRNAVDNIAQNYLQAPFNYSFFYRSKVTGNNPEKLYEAAAIIHDKTGYLRTNALNAFNNRNYEFIQSRKNFESASSFKAGQNLMDDLLEMDIVRSNGNILDKEYLHNYELDLYKITEYEGDTVWVISYKSKKPTLATTGDYHARSYEGFLYIKKKDFAVVKNEMHVTTSNYSPHGRSYFVNAGRQAEKPVSIEYDVITIYKHHLNYYYLSYVNYKRSHQWENKSTGTLRTENIYAEMMITDIETFNPQPIHERTYYEALPYDENFWKTYNVILE